MIHPPTLSKSFIVFLLTGISHTAIANDHSNSVYSKSYLNSDNYQAVGIEYFKWIEDDSVTDIPTGSDYGGKILLNFGNTEKWKSDSGYFSGYDLSYKFGMNSYHGERSFEDEERRDIATRSVYFDVEYFYNFNYRYIFSDNISLDAKGYIGGKHWSKILTAKEVDLNNGETVDFSEYQGFFGLYAKAGIGMKIGDSMYLETGLSAPIGMLQYNNNDDNDGIIFPKSDIGYYAEAEYRFDNSYYAKIYLTQYNYAESSKNDSGFYQPDTDSTTYGITVGQYF